MNTSDRIRISSNSIFEKSGAYSRLLVDGNWGFVSGTAGVDPATGTIPDDPTEQTHLCIKSIASALQQANMSLDDVVRTRIYLSDRKYLPFVKPVFASYFGDIRPANTTIVCDFAVDDIKVEIEVTALRQGASRVAAPANDQ